MSGGKQNLPTRVVIKISLKLFERKRGGYFHKKTLTRFQSIKSVNIDKLYLYKVKNAVTIVIKQRKHFQNQKTWTWFFLRIKRLNKVFCAKKKSLCNFLTEVNGFSKINKDRFIT